MNTFQLLGIYPSNLIWSLLIFLFFAFIFFLIIREIVTWYFKINKAIRILERIERNTRKPGLKYPDEKFDEEYFIRNKISIPGENNESYTDGHN